MLERPSLKRKREDKNESLGKTGNKEVGLVQGLGQQGFSIFSQHSASASVGDERQIKRLEKLAWAYGVDPLSIWGQSWGKNKRNGRDGHAQTNKKMLTCS